MAIADPFSFLRQPRSFDIDHAALRKAYLRASALLHPDRAADPIGRAEAAQASAALNEAMAILSDDEHRADALLLLLGGPAREQEKSLPDGFLLEMMEVRQDMEQALATGDPKERDRLVRWAMDRRAECVAHIRSLFATLPEPPTSSLLRDIRTALNGWRYIERMLEQLDPVHRPIM